MVETLNTGFHNYCFESRVLLSLYSERAWVSHGLGIFKHQIDCTRSCGPRMHFLLRATREITEGKRGIAAGKSSKKPWLPSKGFSMEGKKHSTCSFDQCIAVQSRRWNHGSGDIYSIATLSLLFFLVHGSVSV